jgi:hypothetical protein
MIGALDTEFCQCAAFDKEETHDPAPFEKSY